MRNQYDTLAALVAAAMPTVTERIPETPAAALARLHTPHLPAPHAGSGESRVRAAVRGLGPAITLRLLGALELTVDSLELVVPPGLTDQLERPEGRFSLAVLSSSDDDGVDQAVALVDALHPGANSLVADLVEELARHPAIRELLTPPAPADESVIAARHGAVHLALAVVTAAAVLRQLGTDEARTAPAIIGAALGAAALLLQQVPMPAAYAAALMDKRRAEYALPQQTSTTAGVVNHRFTLAEGSIPEDVDFRPNGLVTPVDGGAAIRTGVADGVVQVHLRVLAEAPDDVDLADVEAPSWDEIVEVGWTATRGGARLSGSGQPSWLPTVETPPWPGDYRLRVRAMGRDGTEREYYELVVWPAPAAPEIVRKLTDRLGHRLRGEPEPPAVVPPDADHRWIESSSLRAAATVTMVVGASLHEVLRGFGADPDSPIRLQELIGRPDAGEWIAAVEVDGVVLAIEWNGFQGALPEVVERLSQRGKAAAMLWNVDALTRLSFARDGRLLSSFEPGFDEPTNDAEVGSALVGLDFGDYRHKVAKGLTAVANFIGRSFTERDLAALVSADVAYRTTR